MHVDLTGKTALVTGAARGLGAALAERLCASGATVWAADVREDALRALCDRAGGDGHDVRPLTLDIRDPEQVTEAITGVYDTAGSIDVLVNNAAVDVTKPIEHLTAHEAALVIGTNLVGSINLCLETYRRMIKQKSGHIVNVLSTAANRTWTEAGPYSASKAGLRAFTHTLFQEAQRDCPGIGVTGIIAGGMRTPFILERFPDVDTSGLQDPAIVADTVLYALSVPASSVVPELVIIPRTESSWP
ncbi:SDR family oxidoreductase [Thermomonospora umbrina]|uniref:NADP-dependent 3-hydroxy acid dehydrogenase YdfG n=1 Tax=Thermomonospora umbrina TaxID=111806 RepID=A0A3D9T224_9ACTN|nr:SDR family oxidoreductase [Thermomonospora umbrina]REE98814.1 NADP-dependent 3-hydroxy acid dehydrogenase YdfG [Thermomonospora umbrina]